VILGVEREVEDTSVLGDALGLGETYGENHAPHLEPIENGAPSMGPTGEAEARKGARSRPMTSGYAFGSYPRRR
jgi:hypothetical protein